VVHIRKCTRPLPPPASPRPLPPARTTLCATPFPRPRAVAGAAGRAPGWGGGTREECRQSLIPQYWQRGRRGGGRRLGMGVRATGAQAWGCAGRTRPRHGGRPTRCHGTRGGGANAGWPARPKPRVVGGETAGGADGDVVPAHGSGRRRCARRRQTTPRLRGGATLEPAGVGPSRAAERSVRHI
jgi:hypothetical protein